MHHAEHEREAYSEQRIGRAEQNAVGDRLHHIDEVEEVHVGGLERIVVDLMHGNAAAESRSFPASRERERASASGQGVAGQDDGLCRTTQLPSLAWT